MKEILTEAVAVGNAASRTLLMSPRDPSWYYYPNSSWWNYLFITGYEFETPIPLITPEVASRSRLPATARWMSETCSSHRSKRSTVKETRPVSTNFSRCSGVPYPLLRANS